MRMSLLYHFHLKPLEIFICLSFMEMESRSWIQCAYKLGILSSVDSIPFSNYHNAYHPLPLTHSGVKKFSLIKTASSSLVISQISSFKIRTSELLEQASIRTQVTHLLSFSVYYQTSKRHKAQVQEECTCPSLRSQIDWIWQCSNLRPPFFLMSKKRGKNAQILLCDIRKGPFTFGNFSNSQKEHLLYLNNTSSPLSDHEKARNENKSLQLNKSRNGILERRINDKTLYIVNHCQFSGKRSKLSLLFKEQCPAII